MPVDIAGVVEARGDRGGGGGSGAQDRVLGAPKIALTLPYPPSVNKIWAPRVGGFGFKKTGFAKKWAKDAGWAYKLAGGRLHTGPVTVIINLHPKDDGHRRDVDNPIKITLDALNGVAWKDDSQIVALAIVKFPAEPGDRVGRAELKIWELAR